MHAEEPHRRIGLPAAVVPDLEVAVGVERAEFDWTPRVEVALRLPLLAHGRGDAIASSAARRGAPPPPTSRDQVVVRIAQDPPLVARRADAAVPVARPTQKLAMYAVIDIIAAQSSQ